MKYLFGVIILVLGIGGGVFWYNSANPYNPVFSAPRPPCENPQVKGNISSEGVKIYHAPGGQFYNQTIIDIDKGERLFCSEDDATKKGWRKSEK